MSLWADYEKERLGRETIEEDFGFIVYHFEDGACSIDEIYVRPEKRHLGLASKLADQVADIAQERMVNLLVCRVWPHAGSSTESLRAILAYGFKLHSAEAGCIILTKKLGGSHG